MANYNGIFLRSYVGQPNTVPRQGALSSSPDIIPYGIQPVSDPQAFFRSNYDSDPGKPLEAGKTNYIYLRGKNYSDKRIEDKDASKPQLYWSKASLLSYPNKWNELTKGPTNEPFSLIADAGAIGVINQPYIWQPDNITNDHYCMIATVPSPGYDNRVPNTLQINDFAGWVARSGGVAWRNVVVNNASTLVLTGAKMYYEQGEEASQMEFTIICTNVPIGTKVSFSAGAPGPIPPIFLEPTIVSTFPSFTTGIICQVPANYVSDVYFNLEAPPGVTNLDTARVQIRAAYPLEPNHSLFELGHTRAELGIPSADEAYARIRRQLEINGASSELLGQHEMDLEQLMGHHEMHLEQLLALERSGPVRMVVVGAMNYNWKK